MRRLLILVALFFAVAPAPTIAQIGEEILPPAFTETLLELPDDAAQAAKSANDLRLEAEEKAAIALAIAAKEAKAAATALARWEADHWEEICAVRDAAEAAAVAAGDRLAAIRR